METAAGGGAVGLTSAAPALVFRSRCRFCGGGGCAGQPSRRECQDRQVRKRMAVTWGPLGTRKSPGPPMGAGDAHHGGILFADEHQLARGGRGHSAQVLRQFLGGLTPFRPRELSHALAARLKMVSVAARRQAGRNRPLLGGGGRG